MIITIKMPEKSVLRYLISRYEKANANYRRKSKRAQNRIFIAGGIGGIFTVLTGHPLDTVKLRLQTMPENYKGTWHAIKTTVLQEGPFSLYKVQILIMPIGSVVSNKGGVMAPLITVVPIFAIGFLGYGYGKDLVADPDQTRLTAGQVLFAGVLSGISTTVVTVPAERIKCLLQFQVKSRIISNKCAKIQSNKCIDEI
ncbi:mitochondrial carnitine/acylcarnitine carrier protein isoform X1 [Megalopta genalis]|uniref:mitochondrial carnitine/acylcarnitine carrier protein isoform X1 n=1 Tax=Megalopta genalis TaxID=115081 RepID=UPI003FD14A8A